MVDHVVPHRGDKNLFWNARGNWQALCVSCHSRKTVKEDGGFGLDLNTRDKLKTNMINQN